MSIMRLSLMPALKTIYQILVTDKWLWILIVGSYIGIWHALPLVNIINDEMYFVGGVLRAIQAKSLLPLPGDVPYGLLTFWLNEIVFLLLLAVMFIGFGFHVSSVTTFLISQANWLYLVPRCVNVLVACVMLFVIRDVFQRVGLEKRTRVALLFLIFTNLITSAVLHTGKMWVLSICLVILSVRSLYLAVHEAAIPAEQDRNIFYSILFAFLAFANFPLCGFALIAIPILIMVYWNDKRSLGIIGKSTAISTVVFGVFFLANAGNIIGQVTDIFTVYHPISAAIPHTGISIGYSFFLHAVQVVMLFPLFLLVCSVGFFRGIKNRPLVMIAGTYAGVYFILICLLVTWSSDLHANLRYLFPLGFFFVLMAAGLSLPSGRWMTAIAVTSFIPYGVLLYLLSIPTTYNQAVSWANSAAPLRGSVILNQVGPQLDLPKDARSYRLMQDKFCGTKCREALSAGGGQAAPFIVIDSGVSSTLPVPAGTIFRFTTSSQPQMDETLVQMFIDGSSNPKGLEIDYGVGSYFDLRLYVTRRFGERIYVYQREGL